MATAAIVGAVIGAAGSIGGAAISANNNGDSNNFRRAQIASGHAYLAGERATGRANLLNDMARDNLTQAEIARTRLQGQLGSPGSYESSYEDFAAQRASGQNPGILGNETRPSGLFGTSGDMYNRVSRSGSVDLTGYPYISEGKYAATDEQKNYSVEGDILNAENLTDYVEGTRSYRMQSYLTAEADQLIRREGPLYEDQVNSVMGPIMEGAAALQRQKSELIADDLAKGGTARRMGLATQQKMRAIEDTNRERTNAAWQAKLAVEGANRDNARTQLNFNQQWVGNVGGIRDAFNGALTQIQQFYAAAILPSAIQSAGDAADRMISIAAMEAQIAGSGSGIGQVVAGLAGIVGGAIVDSGWDPFSTPSATPITPGQQGPLGPAPSAIRPQPIRQITNTGTVVGGVPSR